MSGGATVKESLTVQIDPRLLSYIATRDRQIAKVQYWSPTPLLDNFNELILRGSVKVGGRASCGGAVDPSWTVFTSWNEVVRKATQLGYRINVEPIKHGNAWATKNRGFWDENEYTYPAALSQPATQQGSDPNASEE